MFLIRARSQMRRCRCSNFRSMLKSREVLDLRRDQICLRRRHLLGLLLLEARVRDRVRCSGPEAIFDHWLCIDWCASTVCTILIDCARVTLIFVLTHSFDIYIYEILSRVSLCSCHCLCCRLDVNVMIDYDDVRISLIMMLLQTCIVDIKSI